MVDQHLSQPFGADDVPLMRRLISQHPAVSVLTRPRREDFILAADEIVTNAVRHGGGCGQLEVWLSEGRLWLRVSDEGPGMSTPAVFAAPSPTQLGGRGLWIAWQVLDELTVTSAPTGTVVTAIMIV